MKLVNDLATKVSKAPSGRRKKKQLLLEPPPTPPPQSQPRLQPQLRPGVRAANDDNSQRRRDDADEDHKFGNSTTALADNQQTRRGKQLEQSTKQNLKSPRHKGARSNLNHSSGLFANGERNEFENRAKSYANTSAAEMDQERVGVIERRQDEELGQVTTARRVGRGRQRFENLCHCLQFNRVQQQQQSSKRHIDQTADRDSNLVKSNAKSSSRRKSELTSFLTILFGSMLTVVAVVLLLAANQISCAGQQSPLAVPNATSSQLNPVDGSRADSNGSSQSPATTTVETDLTLDSANESGSSLSNSTLSKDDDTDGGGEEEKTNGERDYEDAPPASGKLTDLLASTARDGTDLMLNHLQGSKDDTKQGDDQEDQPEEKDVRQPELDDSQAAGTTQNSTSAPPSGSPSIGSAANAALLSARSEADELKLAKANGVDGETKLAMETYAKWRAASDDVIELFSRKLLPIIIEHGYDVDSGTMAGMLQVFNAVRQLKAWPLRLLDSWTKLSPGLLLGTQSDFGDFDECLNVRVDDPSGLAAADSEHFPSGELDPKTGLKSTTVVGRYCLADVEFPKPPRVRAPTERGNFSLSPTWPFEPIELRRPLLDFAQVPAYKDTIFVETGNFLHMLYVDPIRVGICLTNKIDPQSFQQVFNKLLDEFHITINFRGRCVTKYDKQVWTSYQLVSYYVLLVACSLVALSTCLDLLHRKLNKLPCPRSWRSAMLRRQGATARYRDLFTSFSLIRNTKRLFKAPTTAATATTIRHHVATCPIVMLAQSGAGAPSSCSIADSSVESSPSIERRSSADSTRDLISLQNSRASSQDLRKSPTSKPSIVCYCDDLASNLKAASATTTTMQQQQQVDLLSLHGIRVITMVWMIVNHTYMFGGFFVLWAYRRLIDIAEWPKSLSFQLVLNGWLTVETYFFLSAMIIVLNVMPLMRAGKFNYFLYILHRLIRLLPAYVGLVCLNFLWPLISNGPVWLVKGKSFVQEPCEQYLWTNFLFINNWFWPEKQCMVHTWFLSADFQLYILAPIIVYLLYKRPALGHWLNLIVAVCASVLSGFVIYANQLLPTTLINKLEFDAIKQQLSYSYFATYQHSGPYCLGLLVGYLLHKRPQVRLPKYLTWSLWLLLPPLSITTLLLTYLWNGAYPEDNLINPSPLVSALYVAIHRTIWTALLAWLVFACATGRAKLLSSFLSNIIFLPISRLSYSIYLVHLPVIMFRALNLRHTVEWTDQNILWESCGNFVVSSLLGFFLFVAFESPIINLERVLFGRSSAISSRSKQPLSSANSTSSQLAKNMTAAALTNDLHGHHSEKMNQNQSRPSQGSVGPEGASLVTAITGGSSQRSYSSKSNSSQDDVLGGAFKMEAASRQQDNSAHHQTRSRSTRVKKSTSEQQLQSERTRRVGPMKSGRKQWATADESDQHQNTGEDQENDKTNKMSGTLSGSIEPNVNLVNSTMMRRQRGQEQLGNQDDLYNITREYRHYAPGTYQQWRRTLGHHQQLEDHHQIQSPYQQVANSRSMRAMQYATLARASRPSRLREQQVAMGRQRASITIDRSYQEDRRWNLYGPGEELPASVHSNYMQDDNLDDRDLMMSRHNQLFPNSSELGFNNTRDQDHEFDQEDGARSALTRQRQLLASRRRQGRYNTLTGSGARDWRSQLHEHNLYNHKEQFDTSQPQDEPSDLLRPWAQQQPQPSWSSANGMSGDASDLADGSLFIPRVDWSSTIRRQARNLAPAISSGSLLNARQDQLDVIKTVEEEPAAEAEETSAL